MSPACSFPPPLNSPWFHGTFLHALHITQQDPRSVGYIFATFMLTMINLLHIVGEMQYLYSVSRLKLGCLCGSIRFFSFRIYRSLFLYANSFLLQVLYFISLSWIGFWVLKSLRPRTQGSFDPRSLDLFFTSVSAATVSSMSAVEMEVFSNPQLIVLTILMFVGGEVFTSMVGLHLKKHRLRMLMQMHDDKVASVDRDLSIGSTEDVIGRIELGLTQKSRSFGPDDCNYLRYISIKLLGTVVSVYLVVVHVLGIAMVSLYFRLVSSARNVLRGKGLNMVTFSIFTTVSTFASCGYIPTNENMIVFSKNSALLLILIPQVLLGNTLFPSCIRFCLWVLHKFTNRTETSYLLRNTSEVGYLHLLPELHSRLLVVTVFGFIGVQFVMFCAMQWNSDALGGLSLFEKIVGVLFQCVNSRHTGETIVDLSTIAPAMLALFVVMMSVSLILPLSEVSKNG